MGKVTGFLEYAREGTRYRPAHERVQDWNEVQLDPPVEQVRDQAARCMDCGIPFCVSGCPLGNVIPDWNDLLYREKIEDALVRLHSTNNFPEFTGLVCPAPCEAACVLGINDDPVSIKQMEWEIVRSGWERGLIEPKPPVTRSGRSVAVARGIGTRPALFESDRLSFSCSRWDAWAGARRGLRFHAYVAVGHRNAHRGRRSRHPSWLLGH